LCLIYYALIHHCFELTGNIKRSRRLKQAFRLLLSYLGFARDLFFWVPCDGELFASTRYAGLLTNFQRLCAVLPRVRRAKY